MMIAGYQLHYAGSRAGARGLGYTYVMASNGLWLEADNGLLAVRVPIAAAEVRGLAPLAPEIELIHGRIPAVLGDLALSILLADTRVERYAAIVWNGSRYSVRKPEQENEAARTQYEVLENTVFEIHSHPNMKAFFSPGDTADEQGLKVCGVAGHIERNIEINLRVAAYGYFGETRWTDIFDGDLVGAEEVMEVNDDIHDRD